MSAIEPDLLATVANMALAYKARLLGVVAKPATAAKLTALMELHRSQSALPPTDGGYSFQELTQVWAGDEFECWFEPQVNLAPESFMPAVQVRGLSDDFVWLLLQHATAQARRWQREGHELLSAGEDRVVT